MPKAMVIRKANDLVEARYKLTLAQQRILLFLNAQIKPWDKDFDDYNISVIDFCRYLEIDPSNVYEEFIKMSQSLISKTLVIGRGEKTIVTAWLSSAVYDPEKGIITLRFSPELRDFLLELKGCYISYSLNDVKHFRSTYSYRIYELLKQYLNLKERTFDLDTLKEILQIKNAYRNYNDFKKCVLIVAQLELEKKADIFFKFEEIKKSRRIAMIRFLIYQNLNKKMAEVQSVQLTIDDIPNTDEPGSLDATQAQPELIPELHFINEHLTVQQRNAIHRAANGDIERIRRRYDIIKSKPGINDLVGYLISILHIPDDEFGAAVPVQPKGRASTQNRFVNFQQRNIDFEKLEQLEREQLMEYIQD